VTEQEKMRFIWGKIRHGCTKEEALRAYRRQVYLEKTCGVREPVAPIQCTPQLSLCPEEEIQCPTQSALRNS